ncbi:MAG TPA: GAF domain-containing protein, partial [Anaerolineales bacterium]|nr:GAF domain-containing protein [Anaerolineales bacterium]
AGNIAIAVEDTRLYSALRRRAEQLTTISEVSSAITSILNLDELLDQVITLIQKRFDYPYVYLFTVHPRRRKIIFQAGSDPRRNSLRSEGFAFDLDDPQGIIPWAARHAATLLVNDTSQEPRYRPSELPPENTLSELAVPLIFANEVLGVLDIQSDRLNEFSEEDRFLFEALADTIAVAMRNAFLYRTEKWRRQVSDSLREVAGLLSADVDLDQVLDAILAELERTLPCDVAAIWLLDEFEIADSMPPGQPHLRLGAVLGVEKAAVELTRGIHLEDLVVKLQQDQAVSGDDDLTVWLIQALDGNAPLIRSSKSPYEPLGRAFRFPPDYSAIASPLRVGEQVLGLLVLGHHTPGRYGSEAQAMTAAFASYASVAIENTRLYEAAHEQAWVSTVLLQVAEASQNLTNQNELLSTIVRITPMLIGVRSCALYIWDDLEEAFSPAAYEGLTTEQKDEFERWRFAAGDSAILDRLRLEKKPIILHGLEEDPHLEGVLFDNQAPALLPGAELLVLIPMISRGEVGGAFLVDYTSDLGNEAHPEMIMSQFDERLAIIQGIAHQTAVAVENIRLQKAQREEAYVSVALLQVAQAVTSLTDLDDILSSIVRITPILVGVRRSMIFLWQEADASFLLAESYGLPRTVNGRSYPVGEFDLLDSALQLLNPVAFPADNPELLTPELAGIEPPDLWTEIVLEDVDVVEEYLESDLRLLIALPLIAKGEILGVMLVEEPEVDSIGGREGGRALR